VKTREKHEKGGRKKRGWGCPVVQYGHEEGDSAYRFSRKQETRNVSSQRRNIRRRKEEKIGKKSTRPRVRANGKETKGGGGWSKNNQEKGKTKGEEGRHGKQTRGAVAFQTNLTAGKAITGCL